MESIIWPENLLNDRNKAIRELLRGREFTNQLGVMLSGPLPADGSVSAEDLVMKIMGSFSNTISILDSSESDEVSQIPASSRRLDSPCRDGRKSEDSGQSSKTSAAYKDRRGCYKRRKTSHTSIKLTPNLIDDGHAWRKYGQKVILNARHPRNYFRCTHKFDQGCQATKQVQMTENEPAMHKTTYHGFHTCKNLLKAPQIILDSTHPATDSSYLLCFDSDRIEKSSDRSLYPHLAKQEHKQNFHMSDYHMSPDLTTIDSPGPMTVLSPGSDHGDVISSGVYSCTASTHSSFGMDLMGSVDFADDDVFQFAF
ncbi:hypothetical protein RJ639_007222 [Escallonia herrerae]|uniref:WRKY domain-containing protein n=1 Tax=Escallonia herrerae TaxID=1293975 RepID=A0AA89AUJ7_9ASTE|nr:hypothetical protein RJ639_007222 [Escallonia herrerae]